jgi:NAD(P)H-dependent FMN reductase
VTSLQIVVIYGSVRRERQGIRAVRFVVRSLQARGHEVSLVDPLDLELPLLDRTYRDYPRGEAPAWLERLASLYRVADAFVIVTGEYNHGIPPALTNLLDYFYEEYFFRPSAIVSYSRGPFSGVRAAAHLQSILCELGMPSVPRMFPIARVSSAFDENGGELMPEAGRRFDRFAAELEWYAEALKRQRDERGVPGRA